MSTIENLQNPADDQPEMLAGAQRAHTTRAMGEVRHIEPGTKVLTRPRELHDTVFMHGSALTNWVCAKCHTVLLHGVDHRRLRGYVFCCPRCDTLNAPWADAGEGRS